MGKVIGILSLKGGVGKTSAVLSLGSAISEFGKRVLLVDGNFSAPNLGVHLNIIEPESTIHHVLNGDQNIEDAIINLEDFDLDLIPASMAYRNPINPFKLKDKIKLLKDRYDIILIDSSPALKKFPPKRKIDVFLDLGIMFSFFLYIYSTQLTIVYFLATFIIFKILDYFWLWSSERQYKPTGIDKLFLDTWMRFNIFEAVITAILIGITLLFSIEPLIIIIVFISFRIITRIMASLRYKKIHFV